MEEKWEEIGMIIKANIAAVTLFAAPHEGLAEGLGKYLDLSKMPAQPLVAA